MTTVYPNNSFFKVSLPLLDRSQVIEDNITKSMFLEHWEEVAVQYQIDDDKRASVRIDTTNLDIPRPLHAYLYFPEAKEDRHKIIIADNPVVVFDLGRVPLSSKYASLVVIDNEGISRYGRTVVFRVGRDEYKDAKLLSPYSVKSSSVDIAEDTLSIHIDFPENRPQAVHCYWMCIADEFSSSKKQEEIAKGCTFELKHCADLPKGLWRGAIIDENELFLAQVSFWVL